MPPPQASEERATVTNGRITYKSMELPPNRPSQEHDWTISMTNKFLSKIKDKQIEICNKEKAIRILESHKNRNTIPKSLRISAKIQVSTERQGTMNEIIANATKAWEKTVMEGLLQTRRSELEKLGLEQSDVMTQWQECLNMTHAEMLTEGLITPQESTAMINSQKAHFEKQSQTLIQSIRSKAFFDRKTEEEQRLQLECVRAERDIDLDLQDPAVAALQLKVHQLERQLKQIPKKDNVKPDKKIGGGISNKMKRTRSKKPAPQKTPPKKGRRNREKGPGNPTPRRPLKRSTNQ